MRLSIKYGPFSTDRKASRFYDKLVNYIQTQGVTSELRGARMSADCRSITVKTKGPTLTFIPFADETTVSVRIHISEYLTLTKKERRGVVIFNHNAAIAKPYVVRFPDEAAGETASFVFKSGCYEVSLTVDPTGAGCYEIKHHLLQDLEDDGYLVKTDIIEEGDFKVLSDLETLNSPRREMLRLAYEKVFVEHQPIAHSPRTSI